MNTYGDIFTDTTVLLTATVTVLTSIVVYNQIKVFTFWSSRGIKGPTPFPFIGTNIYYMFKHRVELDQEWRNKYGHTYGLYDGQNPVLQTTDNELLKFVNIKNFSSFTDRDATFVHSDQMKRWTFFTSGDHWSNQRALITPMFSGSKMRLTFNLMATSVKKFLHEVETRQMRGAKELAGGEERYHMMDEMDKTKALVRSAHEQSIFSKDETMALSLDVISRGFFSLNLNTYRDKASEFYRRAYAFASFDVPFFILWCLVPSFVARYLKMDQIPRSKFEYFDKLSLSMVRERRNNPRKTNQVDMLQNLMEAQIPDKHQNVYTTDDQQEAHYNDQMSIQELEKIQRDLEARSKSFRKFSDEEIAGQMTFFFLAGFETTSSSLAFCIYEFGHQQELQEEVYAEIKEIIGDKDIDYDSLMSLKKLDAFISEALRLYNPVTLNTRSVTAPEGVNLPINPPVHLPKGTVITYDGVIVHREPEYWDEPLKFDMTRFYPENKHKIKSCTYHPFGIGPRNCAGMRFALLQIKLVLANLILRYKLMPGLKSQAYPPEYNRHAFFLQLKHTDFRLIPRQLSTISS